MILAQIDKRRFDALAGYARHPRITLISDELAWFTDPAERVLGALIFDRIDEDFGWVVFGRDADNRFRAINLDASYRTVDAAHESLVKAIRDAARQPDEAFHQGDERGKAVDFFAPAVVPDRLNSTFKILFEDPRYSPARAIIQAMMRYHEDLDGNFVEKFQTAGFDALLWELYLFATFTELGYVRDNSAAVPDYLFNGNFGSLAIEATSVNPSSTGPAQFPDDKDELKRYFENYIPIRLSTALRAKLNRKPPYWEDPRLRGIPFCLAVQDFHVPGAMKAVVSAATEYVFGVRHSIEGGIRKIERIKHHRYLKKTVQSGFFGLANSENIGAVIVSPQGTITKFNRLGHIAGFGDPRVKMIRRGFERRDSDRQSPWPRPFVHDVDYNYEETWVEGMVVLHNPDAATPLDPALIPGAAHEFLQPDGSIMSLLPDFHPLFSETFVGFPDSEVTSTDEQGSVKSPGSPD